MTEILNWFGWPVHPTDEYVHWRDRDKEALAKSLRACYDAIQFAGFASQLDTLLDAAYQAGAQAEIDANAGPEL